MPTSACAARKDLVGLSGPLLLCAERALSSVRGGGGPMTCVECGAEIGRAGRCRRCKAPVTRWSGDEVPGTNPAGQQARRSRTAWVARVLVGAVNLLAVWLAAAFVGV